MTKRRTTSTPKTDSDTEEDDAFWDHDLAELRPFLIALAEILPEVDENHARFVQYGYVVEKGKTIVNSKAHAEAIKDGTIKGFTPPHTFTNPFQLAARFPVSAAVLEEADTRRFVINPEALDTHASQLCSDILGRMGDKQQRRDYRKACGANGATLLEQLEQEAADISDTISGAVDDDMTTLMIRGLESASLGAFNTFRRKFMALNATSQEPISEKKMAARFIKVVHDLGPEVESRLALEMTRRSAHGDLALTVKSIRAVFGNMASSARSKIALGSARAAKTDPRKTPLPRGETSDTPSRGTGLGHPDRPWDKSKGDRPCRHCAGKHWNNDCMLRQSNPEEAAKLKAQREASAKALAAKRKADGAAGADDGAARTRSRVRPFSLP